MIHSNPLQEDFSLPPFSRITAADVVPAIDELLRENRARIGEIASQTAPPAWEILVRPLEDLDDRLSRAWSPVSHLNSVANSEELRAAYNDCLPKLSEYWTEIGQDARLFEAYRRLSESPEASRYEPAQHKIIDNALRDFRLSGVDLPADKKMRFSAVAQELSRLQSQFQDNLLDATQGWSKQIEDPSGLSGIPASACMVAKQTAESSGKSGWLFTLEFPSYQAIMTYADDRALREEFYTAYNTRASDQGPNAGRWDNSQLMDRILALRFEQAGLLGYPNYAELSLATKMAESGEHVIRFLTDLAERARPYARNDLSELEAYAREHHGMQSLEVWDMGYFSEKLREYRYAFSEEDVRAYFPAPRVVSGMFRVVERLYGLDIRPREGVDVWHPDVTFYDICDRAGVLRGSFYLDLYARPKKRGGAWMDSCVTRRRLSADALQIPVAYLTCNFTPPAGGQPALLRHTEVVTLFHEFGHGLHHLLTQVDYRSVSGILGVEWDAVELPSQFMENYCWDREALALISGHFESGEPLPDALFDKMISAKNFQSGMQMVRQLELALFDFRLHAGYDPDVRVQDVLDQVRRDVAVVIPPRFNRFQHGFAHIFAGGYAAGYYSYKWAEVLSSDAFARFEEEGVLNPDTGASFLSNVLEKGGSRKAIESFVAFRGREPTIDALLRHGGMSRAA